MNEKFFTLSPEKQARITNAALEVFARNDYKHASTDDIAAKAGISKGLLFYYFRNKQSLYLYLYDYALEQVRGQVLRQKLDGVTDFFELMHIGARAKLELLTRCPYLLEFSIRAFYSRGEAVSDAVQARLNGDLTGSFAQYFSNIDFSKFRPGVDPAQLLRMLTWMTEGYMNEKQRAGVPLRLEDILADYSGWEEMFRKIAYKEDRAFAHHKGLRRRARRVRRFVRRGAGRGVRLSWPKRRRKNHHHPPVDGVPCAGFRHLHDQRP